MPIGNGNGHSIFYKAVKAPAIALDKTVTSLQRLGKKPLDTETLKHAKNYWTMLGPGLIIGAADDDPSGIATYSQTGAQYGFQLLWLAGFTFPLMALVQEMCARLGLVTGRGLAGNIRIHYPKWVLYTCAFGLFFANTLNIGADLGAMAKGVQLLYPQVPFFLPVVGFTLLSILLQVYMPYHQYSKVLKYLVFILFTYIAAALLSHIDVRQMLTHSIIPSLVFSKDQLFLITGILGTTISPYLFFWQTSQECEEKLERKKGREIHIDPEKTLPKAGEEIKNMRADVWTGMFVSNLVMFFIIVSCAATLFSHGITNITSASDAALALKPIAGNYVYFLFAAGIIGAGLLAVPILAGSASYAISETFGWKTSLSRKLKDAYPFYGVIII